MTVLRISLSNNLYKRDFKDKEYLYNDLRIIFKSLKPYQEMIDYEYDWVPMQSEEYFIDAEQLDKFSEEFLNCIALKPLRKIHVNKELPDLNSKEVKLESVKEILAKTLQVHLPSNELLNFKVVTHIDDACTDELQRKLDDGYKIIAVLPQAGQRRPDYILGK